MMLGKCRQPEQASLLFEIMLSEGLRPTVDVYTALVSAYGQSGLLDKALCTLDDMKSVSDCKPDVYTYSILINCCSKSRHFDLIGRIRAEMSYLGIECSTVTYNTIIDGYGKAEMFELMENTLTDMIESGSCLPDVFTLNTFVGAYGKSGQIEKLEKWYNEFQLMGIRPDIKTFNILIKAYGKVGMYEKMSSVMDYMKKWSFSPTIVTFNTVIELFGKAGNIKKMDEYFKKMKHQGMKPNSITYCSLVSAYSKAGHITKVDSILRQVENSDVILDTPFFNCIISAYGQAGDVRKMSELFLEMKERACKPDSITFATMIQAYNAQGMPEAAENLEKMIATKEISGISPCLILSNNSVILLLSKNCLPNCLPFLLLKGNNLTFFVFYRLSLSTNDDRFWVFVGKGGSIFKELLQIQSWKYFLNYHLQYCSVLLNLFSCNLIVFSGTRLIGC
jgi:pentatricopeptide repeat protein